jgi:hypothetical protein
METVFAEVESVKFETEGADHDRYGSSIRTWNGTRRSRSVWSFDRNFEAERADRKQIKAKRSSLNQNSAYAAEHSQKLTPDAATIFSQLARQAQKIYRNARLCWENFRNCWASSENWFWTLLLLYASGQIKVSCHPFFDTAPAKITHRQGRIKKRILPNTASYGRGRGHNFQPTPNQAQKIPAVTCWDWSNCKF